MPLIYHVSVIGSAFGFENNFSLPGASGGGLLWVLNNIANALLAVVATAAVLFIIVGAFFYITATSEEAAEKGKKSISWAVRGLILAILSWSIVNIIVQSEPLRTNETVMVMMDSDSVCTPQNVTATVNTSVVWMNNGDNPAEIVLNIDGKQYFSGKIAPEAQHSYTTDDEGFGDAWVGSDDDDTNPTPTAAGSVVFTCHPWPAMGNPSKSVEDIEKNPAASSGTIVIERN